MAQIWVCKRFVDQHKGGSAQPQANAPVLKQFRFLLPPIDTQTRIANILSAYDDLIANNNRRMALLEELIHLLYREWFDRLRFPGHERVKVVDGVPEGWSSGTLGAIAGDVRRIIHPTDVEPGTPYVGLEHIPRESLVLTGWGVSDEVSSSKHTFEHREILFGKIRPYFHKVVFAPVSGICSSDAIVIRPHEPTQFGLTLAVTSSVPFVAYASKTAKEGSKMPRANWKVMTQYPVLIPPETILNQFNTFVLDIARQIENLIFSNQKLREARDMLLPRLMNGDIIV